MKRQTLKDFHNKLSWNTKIYTLLTFCVATLAKFTDAMNTDFAFTIILGLLIVLFVESFAIISVKYPIGWKYTRWIIFLIVLGLIILGYKSITPIL